MAFAHKSVAEAKFQHLASILAEWLDNDEDGCVDTPAVLTLFREVKNEIKMLRDRCREVKILENS